MNKPCFQITPSSWLQVFFQLLERLSNYDGDGNGNENVTKQ